MICFTVMSIIESEEDIFIDSHRHWVHYVRKERSAQIIVIIIC